MSRSKPLLPLLLLLLVPTVLFAASSSEHVVGDALLGAASGYRDGTAMASDGTDFLAVWDDQRFGAQGVVAARISATGELLDATGIQVAIAQQLGNDQVFNPHVVFAGDAYAVLWQQTTNVGQHFELWGARIGRDGKILTPARLIATDALGARSAAVLGNRILDVYMDKEGDTIAVLLDEQLNTIARTKLADDAFTSHYSVAVNGTHFGVVWQAGFPWEKPRVEGVRVSASGELLDATPVSYGEGRSPQLASDGERFALVAFAPFGPGYTLGSRGLNADLTPSTPFGHFPTGMSLDDVTIAWRNDHYFVVTRGWGQRVTAARIGRDGLPDADSLQIPADISQFAAAASNRAGRVMIANIDHRLAASAMVARPYDGSIPSPAGPGTLISVSANAQYDPAVAFDGSLYLVAWREEDGIYAARVNAEGRTLDGRGLRLAAQRGFARPRVAFDGTNFVVAYSDAEHVRVRYVSPSQGLLSDVVTIDAFNEWNVALATTGDAAYVAYTSQAVYAVRIPTATHTADLVPLKVSPENMYAGNVSMAFNGTELLVAWNDFETGGIIIDPWIPQAKAVWAALVTPGLTLLDPAPLLVGDAPQEQDYAPMVASDGHDWLVVWQDVYPHPWVLARRVLHDGRVEGDEPSRIAVGTSANVTWDGTRYAIAWKDTTRRRTIRVAYVNASGALAPSGTTIVALDSYQSEIGLARAGDQAALAYARTSLTPEHGGAVRTFLRLVEPDAPGPRRRAVR